MYFSINNYKLIIKAQEDKKHFHNTQDTEANASDMGLIVAL